MSEKPALTIDNNSAASDPGNIELSPERLKRFHPELYRKVLGVTLISPVEWFFKIRAEEQLKHGDSRAAVVASISPLLIAAYTDEMDWIAMLRFPDELVREYGLKVGTRLLTVNVYQRGEQLAGDLQHGPASRRLWVNFHPLIAEFLSENRERIEARKAEIGEEEWERTALLAREHLAKWGEQARSGLPRRAETAAKLG